MHTMDNLNREDVTKLAQKSDGLCVSIYMPAHRKSPRSEQDRTRFKNLVRRAEKTLKKRGPRNIEKIIEPARRLLDDIDFWNHQNNGLAVFANNDIFRYFRLPQRFAELLVVTDRFHTKPLLPLVSEEAGFHILALSQKHVRLLTATRFTVDELELEDIPKSLEEAMRYDVIDGQQLQLHRARGSGGQGAAVFHGQVMGDEDNKEKIEQFLHRVDNGVTKRLSGDGSPPLVLAGVEFLQSMYREVSHYANILDEGVRGNPDERDSEELHRQAKKVVEPYFSASRHRAVELYRNLTGTEQASHDVKAIARAALHGRVSQLLVARDTEVWGTYDEKNDEVVRHEKRAPGDEDLLDFAAAQTLQHGGTVFVIDREEMPDHHLAAAVFRY
jgi:hypothetical protein